MLVEVRWWIALAASMAACGPGTDATAEERCATVTELFTYAQGRSVRFGATTGADVPEAWLVSVQEEDEGSVTVADGLRRESDGVYRGRPGFEVPGAFVGFADFDGDGREDAYAAFSQNVECGRWNERYPSGLDGLPRSSAGSFASGCFRELGSFDVFGDGRIDFVLVDTMYGFITVELVDEGRSIPLGGVWNDQPASAHAVANDPDLLLLYYRADPPDGAPTLALHQLSSEGSEQLWRVEVPDLDAFGGMPAIRTSNGVRVLAPISEAPGERELHRIDIAHDGMVHDAGVIAADVGLWWFADFDGDEDDDLAWRALFGGGLHVRFADEQFEQFEPEQIFADALDGSTVIDHDGDGAAGLGFATHDVPGAAAIYSIVTFETCTVHSR